MRPGLLKRLLRHLLLVGTTLAVTTGTADAAGGYHVTFVARACPSYSAIAANGPRDDSIQSLEDLAPSDRSAPRNCGPLRHWAFTLGTGPAGPVTGAWGSLSTVADPLAPSTVTNASGAATVKLTAAELAQAQTPTGLWAQGGAPSDPVLARARGTTAAPAYGFGSLSCATADAGGGNAQRVFFPAGTTHVFCHAYYVRRPPAAGTIVIHQRVEGGPPGFRPAFQFKGALSYAPAGFTLKSSRSLALHRAGGTTWTLTQPPVPGYKRKSVDCSSRTGTSVTAADGATLSVALARGDTVNCTFVSRWVQPVGNLTIFQITEGGVGSFSYIVEPHDDPTLVKATTRQEGVPVKAGPEENTALLATELYSVQQFDPAVAPGHWSLVGAECDGRPLRLIIYDLRLVNGKNTVCAFTNRFVPTGSITLSSVTEGGTGTAEFVTRELGPAPREVHATGHLPRGSYLITEQTPLTAPAGTAWKLAAVTCNGHTTPVSRGSVVVHIDRRTPHLSCTFRSRLQR